MSAPSAVSSVSPLVTSLPEVAREPCCTRAKVYKVALVAFALLYAVIAGLYLSAAISAGSVILGLSFAFYAFFSGFYAKLAFDTLDFESPKALEKMRQQAPDMTFEELDNKFQVHKVITYNLLPPDTLRVKFEAALVPKPA